MAGMWESLNYDTQNKDMWDYRNQKPTKLPGHMVEGETLKAKSNAPFDVGYWIGLAGSQLKKDPNDIPIDPSLFFVNQSKTSSKPKEPKPTVSQPKKTEDSNETALLKDALKKYETKSKKLDLSALLALTDSWTGSRLLAAYDRPPSDEERQAVINNLKLKISEKQSVEDYKNKLLDIQRLKAQADIDRVKAYRDIQIQKLGGQGKSLAQAEDRMKRNYRNNLLNLSLIETNNNDKEDPFVMARAESIHADIANLSQAAIESEEGKKAGLTFDTAYEGFLKQRQLKPKIEVINE